MADYESVRQRIVSSVFSRRNAGGSLEETYVAHVKIWEDAGPESGGSKPRYILLSQASNGSGFIHKSKLNTNGSFSVGKTWKLAELRSIRVDNPLLFSITLARTYNWQTENQRDQSTFLVALIRLFRSVTAGAAPLQIEGLSDPDSESSGRQPISKNYPHPSRTPTPPISQTTFPRRSPLNPRSQTPSQNVSEREWEAAQLRDLSQGSGSQSRTGGFVSRSASPSNSTHGTPPSSNRSGINASIHSYDSSNLSQSASTIRPRIGRRPSNAASTSSQIPSINLPSSLAPPSPSISSATPRPTREKTQALSIKRPSLDVPSTSSSPLSTYTPSGRPQQAPSPAPSNGSHKQPSRGVTPAINDVRRDHNVRVSFFDPANQAVLDSLISGGPMAPDEEEDGEESAQATMTNVEEMLEGYEWASDDVIERKTARGAADLIEARLLDELMALEKANIHSFLESDDRIDTVLKFMEDAITELDTMDSLVSSYKIHLNAVGDDISYIQSQNRGLQVQTQNQKTLLTELENLLQTVKVDKNTLLILAQESLEQQVGINRLEEAAVDLYKALQAGRDTDMAATMERLDEYRTHNAQFCKRIHDFLSIMFTAQSSMLLGDTKGLAKPSEHGRPSLLGHQEMETYLGRYSGLMLYLREMDESMYGKLCAAYFSSASELHSKQIKALLSVYSSYVKKVAEDDHEQSFSSTPASGTIKAAGGIRRAGTIIRSPLDGRRGRDGEKDRTHESELQASEALSLVLEQMAPQVYREDDFMADFLQINDAGLTFADYAGLGNYFRRQAARAAGSSAATTKLIRGAMELIFGFLPAEIKAWLDNALAKDNMQVIGVIAALERFLIDAEERGNAFLLGMLEKQHLRLKGLFDRHVAQQIKAVEETKLTSKRRNGVAHFIKYFPVYIGRVENQLVGADGLEIRGSVDAAYDKIVQTMFESLKHMAKMNGEGEDKGQLNYHVILIENMHYFVAEMGQLEIGSVAGFLKHAEAIYNENLGAYVKIVLRRPFAKIIDYFEGVERLLKTTAPTEVSSNSNYNRSALKKVLKEYSVKDVRKHVETLFKRVEKHFTEASEKATTEETGRIAPGTVMVGVWKACEDELLRIREVFVKRISQCYADSGVLLEFTAVDIETAFRRR